MTEWSRCHVCESAVRLDGDEAARAYGSVLCRGCRDRPVVVEAVCESPTCGWSTRRRGTEHERAVVEELARSQAALHERVHGHETDVSEVSIEGLRETEER